MRTLHDFTDIDTALEPLRDALSRCLTRWLGSGVLAVPTDATLHLVEAGDDIQEVSDLLGMTLDPDSDDFLGFEWVSDVGPCYEAYVVFTDDGSGFSLLVPKMPGIDGRLLAMCEAFVSPDPDSY